jgi:hypothetical protein
VVGVIQIASDLSPIDSIGSSQRFFHWDFTAATSNIATMKRHSLGANLFPSTSCSELLCQIQMIKLPG